MDRQIIAMGGGGFSMDDNSLLDQYILDSTGKPNPKVCFVPTASGDSDGYTLEFYKGMSKLNCRLTVLQLFKRTISDLTEFVCSQDIIYVGGGNSANMLMIWKTHGLDLALKTAYDNGTVLAGLSAGSICWFEQGVTDSFGYPLRKLNYLGFLNGSNCPHYDSEVNHRGAYHDLIKDGMKDGYATDDGVGLHFINEELKNIVSSRKNASAYKLACKRSRQGESIVENKLDTKFLG